jgi:hypothetical protein
MQGPMVSSLDVSQHMHSTRSLLDLLIEGNTVKPILNGISRVQNIFLLKPGFRLIKV